MIDTIEKLASLANELDEQGFTAQAKQLDVLASRMAEANLKAEAQDPVHPGMGAEEKYLSPPPAAQQPGFQPGVRQMAPGEAEMNQVYRRFEQLKAEMVQLRRSAMDMIQKLRQSGVKLPTHVAAAYNEMDWQIGAMEESIRPG